MDPNNWGIFLILLVTTGEGIGTAGEISPVAGVLKNGLTTGKNWDTLESRRTLFQLKYVHKMFSSQVALHPFDYFERNMYIGLRNSHSKKLPLKFARIDVVKNSFFFSVVPIWNSLPQNETEQTNSDVSFNLRRTHISAN